MAHQCYAQSEKLHVRRAERGKISFRKSVAFDTRGECSQERCAGSWCRLLRSLANLLICSCRWKEMASHTHFAQNRTKVMHLGQVQHCDRSRRCKERFDFDEIGYSTHYYYIAVVRCLCIHTSQILDWITSMVKCLCLDGSCEPSGPDYSDPTQLDDIDFLVHKTQIHSCASTWIHAGVPSCANLSVLSPRVPCGVLSNATSRGLRSRGHRKNRTRCRVLESNRWSSNHYLSLVVMLLKTS